MPHNTARHPSLMHSQVDKQILPMTKPFVTFAILAISMLITLMVSPSQASTVVETNKARVEVADQQTSTRRSALRDAFAQVLVKMSGSKMVLNHPKIRSALQSPAQFLISYEYDQHQNKQYYIGEFSREAIARLLREAKLPLWGQRRPDTLLWMVNQEERDKWILREGQPDPLVESVMQHAEQRGIPLALPLMDLTDNSKLSVYDIWGLFADRLSSASTRYQPDIVLAARIRQHDGSQAPEFLSTEEQLADALANSSLAFAYDNQQQNQDGVPKESQYDPAKSDGESTVGGQPLENRQQNRSTVNNGLVNDTHQDIHITPAPQPVTMPARVGEGAIRLDWLMMVEGKKFFGSVYAQSAAEAATQLLDIYSDYLGERFAFSFEKQNQQASAITISVANLDELKKYVHVQRFLSDMSVVESAILVQQAGSVAAFDVKLVGSQADFMNALSLDSQLRPVTDTFGRPLEGLNFYWNE